MSQHRNTLLKRFRWNSRGAVAAEVALLFPLYIFMIMAVIEFGVWSWQKVASEHGISNVARAGLSNRDNQNADLQAAINETTFDLIDFTDARNCLCARPFPTLNAAVNSPDLTDCSSASCGATRSAGNIGDFVVYDLIYRRDFITPLSAVLTMIVNRPNNLGNSLGYRTSTIIRNESDSSGGT